MTSTLPPDPPNFPGINYNPSFWSNSASTTGLTYNQALKNFLSFPVSQGTETLQNTNINGILTIINPLTPSETYSQYIDNDTSFDMTLSTAQSLGGLTIRTPTNSFTMQPNTFNQNLITPTAVTGMQMLNPINMANFNIVNMGQYSTAYTQALNTHQDYVATCNYVNNMIVNGGGILDNPNDWTATNTFESYVNIGTVTASNYYSQLSQLADGALNINNQCPSANFPNINFQCNNGSNIMTNYFSITPQELDSFTTLNMNSQNIINCNQITDITGQFVTTNTPPDTDNGQSIATTAYVKNNLLNYAPLVSPIFTGNPTAPTPATIDNDFSIATTAYVKNNLLNYAPLVSPVFTGNPTAPTPAQTDADFSIATTAYVTTKVTNAVQVVRTGLTYTIPSSNVSTTPQPVDNTISNTQSTIFLSLYFTPSISSVNAYGLNFNNNIYNGTYSSILMQEYVLINTSTSQQEGFQVLINSSTNISIKNISSGWKSGVQYYISLSLVIVST